jgi:hypothetical protein
VGGESRLPKTDAATSSNRERWVGLTVQPLSCAARAHVPEPTRRAACLHVSRAMRAA